MFQEKPQTNASRSLRRLVQGVGINDAPYLIQYKDAAGAKQTCPFYTVWAAMVERCFSKKLHQRRPTYKGCSLEPSWLYFSAFKSWMEKQDWENKHLDKDLLIPGNLHYGPSTCLFVTPALNNLLTLRERHRGAYPLGVSKLTINKCVYFVACCSFYGKQQRLGYFKTIDEAATVYKEAKKKYIVELASKEQNLVIKQALLRLV